MNPIERLVSAIWDRGGSRSLEQNVRLARTAAVVTRSRRAVKGAKRTVRMLSSYQSADVRLAR